MPLVVDKEKEKKSILEAFHRCVGKTPLVSVSIRDIAKEANISVGKVFSYFSEKNEIIVSYVKQIADLYADRIRLIVNELTQSDLPNAALLSTLIEKLYEIDPDGSYGKIFVQIYALGAYQPEAKAAVTEAYDAWKNVLMELFRCRNDEEATALLLLVEGVILYRYNYGLDREEATHLLSTLNGACS